MKNTIIFLFALLFTSCVPHSAFGEFDFTKEQQQWENNMVNSEIKHTNKIIGTVTAVYLNKVFPKKYHDGEFFFIAVYSKDKNLSAAFELNGNGALYKERVNPEEFQAFIQNRNEWTEYFVVGFEELPQNDILKLIVKVGEFVSNTLVFKKDE